MMGLPGDPTSDTGFGFVVLEEKDFCYLDQQTIKTLELLENNMDASNKRHSLYGLINAFLSTTTGSKLLCDTLTKPLCHLPTIEHRLNCIEYLSQRIDTLSLISTCIRRYGQGIDLNNVIPSIINLIKTKNDSIHMAEKRLDALSTIEVMISNIEPLVAALAGADQQTLNVYKVALEDPTFQEITNEIYRYIEPEQKLMRGRKSKILRIRKGVESLFDIARSTYHAAIEDMEEYVREIQREDGLWWKLSYATTRGYYLSLTVQKAQKITLPPKYLRVTKNQSQITATTRELMQLNVRANVSYDNSMRLANEILVVTISKIVGHVGALYRLVNIIGMLDLVSGLAKLVHGSHGTMVRPRFTSSETLVLQSRHPMLESINRSSNIPVVANDIKFSDRTNNFMLVTGPNMGGKSVYLKQVALIQIMAQIGSYVPANSADIKLMNRIVARSGTSDDETSNCSSFMWEMKGMASGLADYLKSPYKSVMYIIDEVGRGTSVDCGASYSFAIAEELALRRGCYTVFSTHFDQVFMLTTLYRNILAYHFEYEGRDNPKIGRKVYRNTHNLLPGLGEQVNYGFIMAQECGLPERIIQLAAKMS